MIYKSKSLGDMVEIPDEDALASLDYYFLLTGRDKKYANPVFTERNTESALFNLRRLGINEDLSEFNRKFGRTLEGQDLIYLRIAEARVNWYLNHTLEKRLERKKSLPKIKKAVARAYFDLFLKFPNTIYKNDSFRSILRMMSN